MVAISIVICALCALIADGMGAFMLVGFVRTIISTELRNQYQQLRARTFAKHNLDNRVEEDKVEQLLRAEDPDLMEKYTKDYSNVDLLATIGISVVLSPFALLIGGVIGWWLGWWLVVNF